jgi:hypothetical protein
MSENKCVIVVDPNLPLGTLANAIAVLSSSLGRAVPGMIGTDLLDHAGSPRRGITTLAIPILKGSPEQLGRMREALKAAEPELTVIDLISATRHTRSYTEYAAELSATTIDKLAYFGLALHGPHKLVKQYTGSLALLR